VLYTTWFVSAKELLAESERAVSEPQCHMGADSDNSSKPLYTYAREIEPVLMPTKSCPTKISLAPAQAYNNLPGYTNLC
jgi:hypothetical protein